jgi:hypothetical protein
MDEYFWVNGSTRAQSSLARRCFHASGPDPQTIRLSVASCHLITPLYRPGFNSFSRTRVTPYVQYPIIHLAMVTESFDFWTWRTLFCLNRLSPHRTISMFSKLCLQPAFGKLFFPPGALTPTPATAIHYIVKTRYSCESNYMIHNLPVGSSKIHCLVF